MDEVKKFFSIVRKYRATLLIVPAITVVITYFLVRNLPNSYVSQSQIATGIVDATKQFQRQSLLNVAMLQGEQVNQEFNNLISMMRMKKILDQVSYRLIIHDLTSNKPFREPSKFLKTLNTSARSHALDVYREFYKKRQPLNLWNPDQNGINEVLMSMGYDSESISGKLSIYRSGDSDYITVQFESEDPVLSAFVVNTLSAEFVSYYTTLVKTNQVKTTDFLRNLLREKSDTLSKKMTELRNYKIRNRVLNLGEQSKQLYASIIEYDAKKQEAIQNTSSYAGALNEIDRKFTPSERKYIEASTSKINQDIVALRNELSALYDLYYKSDLDEGYRNSIDSLQAKLKAQINKSSDEYISNPLASKQDLVEQKIDLEVKLDLSRYSINSLESELNRLNSQFDQLVPREAEVQAYEMEIDIATKEYLDILNKYNQSSLESDIPVKLNIVQTGMPGLPQPSKKMLLVILSGVISVFFIFVVLFVLYLLDRRIISADELANSTQFPVLGSLNKMNLSSLNLKEIWNSKEISSDLLVFKNQIRQVRFEVESELQGNVVVVTSLCPLEGKSFLVMNLAASLMIISKKILIIDGNFSNPSISNTYSSTLYFEDFLAGSISVPAPSDPGITILKNRGGDASLMELATEDVIVSRIHLLKRDFDIVLIDAASFHGISQIKEWITLSDDIIGVFNFGREINKKHRKHIKYFHDTGKFRGWILNQSPENG